MLQFGRFLDIIDRVKALGYTFAIRHCANSAATLLYPATYLDMIRPGIVLYGHFPDMNMDPGLCDLVPVLELKSYGISNANALHFSHFSAALPLKRRLIHHSTHLSVGE